MVYKTNKNLKTKIKNSLTIHKIKEKNKIKNKIINV